MKKRRPIKPQPVRRDYSWVLIFASVFVAYLPALNGGLLWDDLSHITFPELRSIGGLWRIWTELGATQQVLSAAALRVLARASALGRLDAGIPPGQRGAPCDRGVARRACPEATGCSWSAAGGNDLRAASGVRGIGGVDFRTEEHAVGRVLYGVGTGVFEE